jgi:beta-lactamase superfamily II metal-dependent hydrolase
MADPKSFVATAPTAFIHETTAGKPKKQLLWGDYVRVTGVAVDGWVPVYSRKTSGWMKSADLSSQRLLEIVFVDIGQGDGALVVTPDDQHLIIDAGEEDNLYRFLRWRYDEFAQPFGFAAAVISHPDQDHYQGFAPIFAEPNVRFTALYHNGLVERTGDDALGPVSGGFVTDIVRSNDALKQLVGNPVARGAKRYPNLLHNLLSSGRLDHARADSSADQHLEGFAPGQTQSGFQIQVLSPVYDKTAPDQSPRLPWLGDLGKTKNGHSVVLRLVYGDISVMLGGDLNIPAEHRLLGHYTGYAMPPKDPDRAAIIEGARKVFRSDVAKACHHGSADFTDLFLQAVDPIVTVISSGDNEPHAHPRADALGAVGRWGRGGRPLVFSTELARSAAEVIKQPFVFRKALDEAYVALAKAKPGAQTERAQKKIDGLLAQIERSIAVYGAINLRSDGKRIVMAQKVEAPSRVSGQWDVYLLEPDAAGVLRYEASTRKTIEWE